MERRSNIDISELIKILLIKRGDMSCNALAAKIGTTPQNLHNKLKKNNWRISDLEDIANVLDLDINIQFKDKNSGDLIL